MKKKLQRRPASSYHHTTTHGHTSCSPNELHTSLDRKQTDKSYFFTFTFTAQDKKGCVFPRKES